MSTDNNISFDNHLYKEFKAEFASINQKLDIFNEKIIDYKIKPVECREFFDKRYLKVSEGNNHINLISNRLDKRYIQHSHFKNILTDELNNIDMDKNNKLQTKTNIIKNIFSIMQALAPYIILFFGFLITNKS